MDPSYNNTVLFASAAAQASYMVGKTRFNLTNYTYQRIKKGVARVGIKADSLYNCNYMMFQNTAFGSKWFYAFITSVEYVNNQASDIFFEIDVLQTWLFDYDAKECYIERMHTPTDVIGEHIEPEPVSPGEYVFHDYSDIGNITDEIKLSDLCVVAAVTDASGQGSSNGKVYNRVYGGATLTAFELTDTDGINDFLSGYVSQPDAVVGLYMCPRIFAKDGTDPINPGGEEIKQNSIFDGYILNPPPTEQNGADLDGYIPKNNKLYTYPYNYYHIDNGTGQGLSLRYEFFDKRKPEFLLSGTVTQPVTVSIFPQKYKGASNPKTESISITNYPMCSWNVDAYKAWMAQNSVPLAIDTGVSAVSAIGSLLTGNIGGAVQTGVGAAANIAKQNYTASIAADISKGNFNNGGVNVSIGQQSFFGGRCTINRNSAKMIDDFFTMYGYQVGIIGIPPRKNRPHFTYVKTNDANIEGNIPADDCKKIAEAYNAGITFWVKPEEVGQWSVLNNKPGGG